MERDVWVVGGTLAVALRVSRVLGAAPLQLEARGATWHARASSAYALYGIVLVTVLNIAVTTAFVLDLVQNIGNPERMILGGSDTVIVMWMLDMLITHSVASYAAYSGRSRMTSLIYHFSQLKKASFRIHKNRKKKQNREKTRTAICILNYIMQFILIANDFVTTAASLTEEKNVFVAYLYGAYSISYMIGVAVGMQLLFLMYEIHAAMESLNDELEWILFNIHETRPLTKAEKDSLRRIAVLYDTVSDVVRHFNTDDGGLMLLKFASFNIYLMIICVYLYDSLSESVTAGDIIKLRLVSEAMWCFTHIIEMAFFVEPCHQTLQEVEKFRVLLTDLMYRTQRPGAPSSLCVDVLYKQLVLDTFNFTPLGVCTITRSFFTTAVSALTTCFVIFVQYRLGGTAKNGV